MGRELVLELLRRGAKVAAVDLREDFLVETKKQAANLNGQIETFAVDVTDSDKVAELPAAVIKKLGSVDAVINNAGIIQPFVKINELSYKDAAHVMNVNFNGPLHVVKSFLPELLKRPEAHILNVSSMGAYAPVPGQSVYGASKAAIKLFTEGLRSELMETKVGVTIVFPGAIETNIAANSGMANPGPAGEDAPKFKLTAAPTAAKAMVDAIENNRSRICIGQDAKIMDFLTRLNPVMAAGIIYKQMKSLLG
jgi:short-subunit dehydrogenase